MRQDGLDTQLGLVDGCFGGLRSHHWSANEKVVIVNTTVLSNPCLHSSWLLDLDVLSVGALDTPWEGERGKYYTVRDLSADGHFLLVRASINHFYNRTTKEQWPIPPARTDNIILLEADPSPSCLFLDKEFSETFFRTHIWNCKPMSGKDSLFATFETHIVAWVISPDRKFIAFIGKDQDFYPEMEALPEGIWLMALP